MLTVTPSLFHLAYFTGIIVCSAMLIYVLLHSPVAEFFKDKPDPRKVHRHPIPRLGGVAIIVAFISCLLVSFVTHHNSLLAGSSSSLYHAILFASVIILVLGFFDDTTFYTVRVRHKVTAEVAVAFAAVYLFNVNIGELSFFGLFAFPLWLSNIVSFLWILGLANAYNIIDGLDGLAGTLALIAFVTLGVLALYSGHISSFFLTLILCGTVIGFLIFNLPPAKTFMGDTGSIFLGTMVAILSLYIGRESVPERAIALMPLIAGIPILEVLVTMTRRFCKAKDKKKNHAACIHSMVLPDNSHMHHRLMYKGYSPIQSLSLLALFGFTLSCGAVGIAFVKLSHAPVILAYLILPMFFMLYQLDFGGRFTKALGISPTRYHGFRKNSLIGLIDGEGSFSQKLEQQMVDGVTYIKILESDIPVLHQHLRAAVVKECSMNPETAIKKAEEMSALLRGPVYIVEDTTGPDYFVREVSRNGKLSISEKTGTVKQLLKDFRQLSSKERIRHHMPPEQLLEITTSSSDEYVDKK